jgi:hypothetical protein
MFKRIWHFLFGHKWSDWKSFVYSPGYYDEERWKERSCNCGAKETDED